MGELRDWAQVEVLGEGCKQEVGFVSIKIEKRHFGLIVAHHGLHVLVEKIVYSGLSAYRSSYAYDKNGRLEYEDCIIYEIVNGDELVEDGMNSRSYKYDKKGNRIEELTYTQWGNSFKTTYKYDKNGNKVLIINESDGDIDEMKLEYDEYGNNEGMYNKDENGNWLKLQAG